MNKKFLLAAFSCCIALGFTACSDDDDNEKVITLTFEDAELGNNGYINNAKYTEQGFVFSNTYDETYNSWYGFSISNNTDTITEGWNNQYSVFAAEGANGSEKFAVAYQSAEYDENWNSTPVYSSFKKVDESVFKPKTACFALTTYTYLSTKKGDSFAKKFAAGDYYRVTVIGKKADGSEATVVFDAVNIDNNVAFTKWNKVNLSELGEVTEIALKFESTDTGAFGMNTPAYIAIDNIEIAE